MLAVCVAQGVATTTRTHTHTHTHTHSHTLPNMNIMNNAFVEAAVVKALLHKTHGVSEIIHVLRRRRQGSPGAFELRPETLNQFLSLVLALKLLHAEIHNPDVEVLASQLRVTCGVGHINVILQLAFFFFQTSHVG